MLAHRYRVWGWGKQLSSGSDIIEKFEVGIITLAKRHKDSPYEVFNELVAMNLGRAIGMPIPPGAVVERDNKPYFASYNFSLEGIELPDGDAEELVKGDASLACGIIIFDAWIGNADRHGHNFWYDHEDNQTYLFDHGMGILNGDGIPHLKNNSANLIIDNTQQKLCRR